MKIPIRRIRDVPVILDADHAAIYGVSTKRLNEQVKWNKVRFPRGFRLSAYGKRVEVDQGKCIANP